MEDLEEMQILSKTTNVLRSGTTTHEIPDSEEEIALCISFVTIREELHFIYDL